MRPLFEWLMPVLTWSVVLWRAPSAFASRANRALWAVFLSAAVALSTRPPVIESALEKVTGIDDVTILIKHLGAVLMASFVIDYVHAIHNRPFQARAARLRLLFSGTASATLTLLFVFCLPHDLPGSYGIDTRFGDPGVQAYLAVVYLVFAVAGSQAAVLFWTHRRNVPAGPLRAGIVCLAAAAGNGFLYALYRIYFVVQEGDSTTFDAAGHPVPPIDPVSELLPAVSIVLLVLGVAVPPTHTLVRYVRDQYALWRLHRLWSDLVTAVPHVVLGTPTSRRRDLFTPGDRSLDVAHRAFAIRDAALVLRDDSQARTDAAVMAEPGTEEEAARAEGEWLRAAVRRRERNLPLPPLPATLDRTTGGRTPREEIAWLLKVAAFYAKAADEPAAV
ncbi:MAB_1171c family putative transporter [Streptomyces sp. NPDC059456]|uniref:MAB_1171c family putative transporter n=1 Tax=Streptomyces sp. NPDC059456 TaxID=3346838 RepID=UPI0036B7E5AC